MRALWTDQSGASSAEYGLLIAIVGIGLGAAALALGANVTASIGGSADRIHAINRPPTAGDTAPRAPHRAKIRVREMATAMVTRIQVRRPALRLGNRTSPTNLGSRTSKWRFLMPRAV